MTDSDHPKPGTLGALGYTESFFGNRGPYYGKYRGKVTDNVDPLGQGRLCVTVPDVTGLLPKMWARACVQSAGPLMGTYICPPPIGAGVWVEFEHGNPDKPVWVGCYWDDQPVPAEAGLMADAAMTTGPTTPFMTTEVEGAGVAVSQVPLVFPSSQVPGNVTLYAEAASITLGPAGVTITAPMISIVATTISISGAVAINGELTVNGPQFTVA
jgi:phage baseplate assembly protein gpV